MEQRLPVRRPVVAGLFYPDSPDRVRAELARLINDEIPKAPARAVVVPHAGWRYSGRVAGAVYGRVKVPRLAVILGPNHTGLGPRGSVMARGRWALPGGEVAVGEELARAILGGSRVLAEDELAHAREHAVEVQLPFLLRLQPEIAFVPITLMGSDLGLCIAAGPALAGRSLPDELRLLRPVALRELVHEAVPALLQLGGVAGHLVGRHRGEVERFRLAPGVALGAVGGFQPPLVGGLVVAPVDALREARQRHLAHEAMGVEVAEAPAVLAPLRVLDDERRRPRRVEPVHHLGLVDHVELDGHEVAPDVPLDVGIRVRHGTHALAAPSVRAEEVDEDQLALGP